MSKRILAGILNWGLGHAARSIPVIDALLKENFEVIIASDGMAGKFLRKKYPFLTYLEAPALHIKYARKRKWMPVQLSIQIPRLLNHYKHDLEWTRKTVKKYGITGIFSDNRPGIWHPDVPSIYFTHQLRVLSGIFTPFSSFWHQKTFEKFTEIWVPDVENEPSLSGLLGHANFNTKLSSKIKYTGPVSRFSYVKTNKDIPLTFLLSGPEPQRTLLESMIFKNRKNFPPGTTLIRGTFSTSPFSFPSKWKIINMAFDDELNDILLRSQVVISRSGYTSVMDLIHTRTNALLIPTPGQPEQEYLAKHLSNHGWFHSIKQERFSNVRNFSFLKQSSRPVFNSRFNFKILNL